jgi:hypothetical protein
VRNEKELCSQVEGDEIEKSVGKDDAQKVKSDCGLREV